MTYRTEIVCDLQTNRTCASRSGANDPLRPFGEGPDADMAKRRVMTDAKRLGWITRLRPMRTPATAWICPHCKGGL